MNIHKAFSLMLITGIGFFPNFLAADDFPVDISKAANMGFEDKVAGDGIGGWSDQGPQNDMRGFDITNSNYSGIKFSILDPRKNNGKAIITFNNIYARTGIIDCKFKFKEPYPKGRYLYLLHTSCWNKVPAKTEIGYLEAIFNDGTKVKKSIRNDIELADWWNAGNCENGMVVVREKNKSTEVGVFLSKIKLCKKNKEVRSLKLHSNENVVWIVVGMSLSDKDIEMNNRELVFKENLEWKAVDMSDVQIKQGTALDLSSLTGSSPAGEYGRAIIGKNGALCFNEAPKKTVRLLAFNGLHKTMHEIDTGNKSQTEKNIVLFAELVKRQGYNMIRPMVLDRYIMDGSKEFCIPNPEKMDNADRLIYELKKRGIYTGLTIGGYRLGGVNKHTAMKNNKDMKAGVLIGDKEMRDRWRRMAEQMLNHVNPYTGQAWKDDPAIIFVCFFNEQETGYYFCSKIGDKIKDQFNQKWQTWLKNKYRTIENVAKAWNKPYINKFTGFSNIKIPDSGVWGILPCNNDFGLFLEQITRDTLDWYESVVKQIGYKGLTTQIDLGKQLFNSEARWRKVPMVTMHSYFNHPSKGSSPGSKMAQNSSISMTGSYWRHANATRFADRPFVITEYNHSFWSKYQHECGLLYPAYSAFQGFSGLTVHEDAVTFKVKRSTWEFSISHSPIGRASEFLSACLFLRGDISKHKHRVEMQIPQNYLQKGSHSIQAVNSEQTKIGLMTGFSISFPQLPTVAEVAQLSPPDIAVLPGKGAAIIGGEWVTSVKSTGKSGFNLTEFTKQMKKANILSKLNLSDPEKGIFQTENGEITMRSYENLIKISTDKTEGVSIEAGKSEKINALEILESNTGATIAVCSMDGNAIVKSSRLVLVYSTEIANSEMKLSSDRVTLLALGKLPILMRCGKLKATLKNVNAKNMALYALAINGTRNEKLPLSVKNGKLSINLDTAKLKNGPTPFFELSITK